MLIAFVAACVVTTQLRHAKPGSQPADASG